MLCQSPHLEEYLTAYLAGAGLRDDLKGPLSARSGGGTGELAHRAAAGVCDEPAARRSGRDQGRSCC